MVLAQGRAVSVLRSIAAVFVVLQQQVDPTAVGLRTVLARYSFFASLVLLNDVLSAVNRLSLVFQRSTIDLTVVWPLLSSTLQTLKNLQQEPATAFETNVKQLIAKTSSEVVSLHQNDESVPDSDGESDSDGQDDLVKIILNEPEKYEIYVRQKFLAEIIKNLQDRFPQI